jgi:Leucine-rich repeat (LRR) protein
MIFARRSALTHRLQLNDMGLTEVPSELFRMKNLKILNLAHNNLCSLPSEIAHLTTLERLYVRLLKGLDRDLTESHVVFQVARNQLTSLPPELGLLTNLKELYVRHSRLIDRDLTRHLLSGRRQPDHFAANRNRPAATARAALSEELELAGS